MEQDKEPIKEEINLEYKVEYEDGLRPVACIYGVDSETKDMFVAEAFIGTSIRTGYRITPNHERIPLIGFGIGFENSLEIGVGLGKPNSGDWEQGIIAKARERNINLIKVNDREHIQTVAEKHMNLYNKQFLELAGKLQDLFKNYMKEHPGYNFPGFNLDMDKQDSPET